MAEEILLGAAVGVALFDLLSGQHGQQLSITDNITTSMTINATTRSVTSCFQSLSGSESIVVHESSDNLPAINAGISTACTYCLNQLDAIVAARESLETDARVLNPGYTVQQANPVLKTQMTTGEPALTTQTTALAPCTALCHDIVIMNVSQSITLKAEGHCEVTNDISTDIQQSIDGQISSYLKNQQDVIGQIESAFTSNTQSIATNMSTALAQNITQNFVQDMNQSLQADQSFEVYGNSILAIGINQSFNGSMVGKMKVNNTVVDQLRQSASYSISQSLLNKNDTIGDLSGDFLQVIQTMSELLQTLTTQILILIGAILATVVMVGGALYVFNKNFHSWADDVMEHKPL